MADTNVNREPAFDAWFMSTVLGSHLNAVAHEAFCAGWEAAAPWIAFEAGAAAGEAIKARTERIAVLEQLAAEMLASFTASDSGHRSRVGQVRIARWRTVLAGDDDR